MNAWVDLAGTVLVMAIAIAVLIQTAVLAASIWLLAGADNNPFKSDGMLVTWAKCAGVVVGYIVLMVLLSQVAGCFGVLLALGAWFLAIMMLFERSFGEAVLIFLANAVISIGVNWVLGQVFA